MRRREFLKFAPLCLVEALDVGGSRPVLGQVTPRPTGINLEGNRDSGCPVAISPNGRWIATADKHCLFKLWDGATGALLWTEPSTEPGQGNLFLSLAFSRDGRRLVAGGHGAWEGLERYPKKAGVKYSPSSMTVVSKGRLVKVWDLETKRSVTLADDRDGALVQRVAFVGGDDSVVAIDTAGQLWRWDGGQPLVPQVFTLPDRDFEGLYPGISAFDANGDRVIAVYEQERFKPRPNWEEPQSIRIRLIDLPSLDFKVIRNGTHDVQSLAITNDGKWMASGSRGGDSGFVTIWDYAQRKGVRQLPREDAQRITFLAFSPDDTLLLSCTDLGDCFLWDWRKARLIKRFGTPNRSEMRAVAFLGQGIRGVSGGIRDSKPDPGEGTTRLEPLIVWNDR